jgi:hypothetical protein
MDKVGRVLAVEVAADRRHASICSACWLDDDRIQIELADYLKTLSGTAVVVDRVVEFHQQWKIRGVVVDSMGGATNLRQPLGERRRVQVVTPDAAAVKVAHADFVDLARAKRLAVVANDVLSTAMQHLTERQLGGLPVFDRRGAMVDVAPLVACELAVWGLRHGAPPIPRSRVY